MRLTMRKLTLKGPSTENFWVFVVFRLYGPGF